MLAISTISTFAIHKTHDANSIILYFLFLHTFPLCFSLIFPYITYLPMP